MLLSELPPEALNSVFTLLDGYEIGLLWFCGSHMLNWKLSRQGGVKSFHFQLRGRSPIVWPSLVSNFAHLDSLYIASHLTGSEHQKFEVKFEKMPQQIRSLRLFFYNSSGQFATFLKHTSDLFPNLLTLSMGAMEGELSLDATKLILEKLPSLTSFNCQNINRSSTGFDPACLSSALLFYRGNIDRFADVPGKFPQQLESLHLSVKQQQLLVGPRYSIYDILPVGLTKLCLSMDIVEVEKGKRVAGWNFSLLPRSLTDLEVHCRALTVDHIRELPPMLKYLRIQGHTSTREEEAEIEMLLAMPVMLQTLRGVLSDPIMPRAAAAIPRSLVGKLDESVTLGAVMFLPSGINSLTIHNSDGLAQNGPKPKKNSVKWAFAPGFHFPDALIYLGVYRLYPELAQRLPSTLKNLLVSKGEIEVAAVKHFPPKLERLSTVNNKPFLQTEAWKSLPSHMKEMDIWPIGVSNITDVTETISRESSLWLPRHLSVLRLGYLSISDPTWFLDLPPSLTTLQFSLASPLEPFHEFLPKQLTYLSINFATPQSNGYLDILSNLSPLLKTFVLRERNNDSPQKLIFNATLQAVTSWPRHLSDLSLPFSTQISSHCARFLPKSLTKIRIQGSSDDPLVHRPASS